MSLSDEAARAIALSELIRPLLAGQGGQVQGAVLADLVAQWLAGHHPEVRVATYEAWSKYMVELIPVAAAEMHHAERGDLQ